MKKLLLLLFCITLSFHSFAADINLWDGDGNWYYGEVENGDVSLWDSDGNWYYGQEDGGDVNLWDTDGNWLYGTIDW